MFRAVARDASLPFPLRGGGAHTPDETDERKAERERDPLGAPHLTFEWAFLWMMGVLGLRARARAREGAKKGVAVGCFSVPHAEAWCSLARLSESSCCTPALGFPNPELGVSQFEGASELTTKCPETGCWE